MSNYIYIHHSQDIPENFKTYSILLIPDKNWLDKIPNDDLLKIFNRFKEFGDIIGKDHAAAWLYTGFDGGGDVSEHFIRHFHIYITYTIEAYRDIIPIIKSNSAISNIDDISNSMYDFLRAKYFCALVNLNFNKGPYVAFFDKKPNLPIVFRDYNTGSFKVDNVNNLVKPSFVIQFEGLNVDEFIAAINTLEFEILRSKEDMKQLRFRQRIRTIIQNSKSISSNIVKSIKFINEVKTSIGLKDIKDIL